MTHIRTEKSKKYRSCYVGLIDLLQALCGIQSAIRPSIVFRWFTISANSGTAGFGLFMWLDQEHLSLKEKNVHTVLKLETFCCFLWISETIQEMWCHQLHALYKFDVYYVILHSQYCLCWTSITNNVSRAFYYLSGY